MYFAGVNCKIDMYYVVRRRIKVWVLCRGSAEEVVRLREFLLSELLVLYEREFLDPGCSCSVKTEFRKAVCWVDEALYLMEGGE